MSVGAVLAPLFVQVLLHLVLGVLLAVRRRQAFLAGEVKQSAAVGDRLAWPKPALLASNAFQNQFEFPLLFYLVVVLTLVTGKAGLLFVVLSWMFVVSRYIHAWVHVTSNHIPCRASAFGVGLLILLVMWVNLALHVFALA